MGDARPGRAVGIPAGAPSGPSPRLSPIGLQGLGIPIPQGLELLHEPRSFGRGGLGRSKTSFDRSPFREDVGQTFRRRGRPDRRQSCVSLTGGDLIRLGFFVMSELQHGLSGDPDLAGKRWEPRIRGQDAPLLSFPEVDFLDGEQQPIGCAA